MANTTLATVQDYVADGRTLLLDKVQPYRYDDPSMLVALNTAMLEGARLRPDLFIYQGDGSVPTFSAVDTTPVNIEPAFRLAFLYGMCAHALLRDEEDVQDSRANTYNGNFHEILIGVRPKPVEGGTPQPPGARK
jgi:hypothetical protein